MGRNRTTTLAYSTTNNMGNKHSKPRRRLPKINVQPDEITSVSDSCLPNSATQGRAIQPVKPQCPPPKTDARRDRITSISDSCLPNSISTMDTTKPHRPLPEIKFRVLIIGRANAGKTSILQRVCETTESPAVYRRTGDGKMNEKVRGRASL